MPFPPLPADDLSHILEHTRDYWNEMRGEQIFVTGGTGFFGAWLVESFLFANEQLGLRSKITLLTRNPTRFQKRFPLIQGNPAVRLCVGDVETFNESSQPHKFVIHAATESTINLGATDPQRLIQSVVNGTQHVLDWAQSNRTQKLLFVSSGAVYGPQPPDLANVPESYLGAPDVNSPNAAYGESKRLAELLCILNSSNRMEIKIARCFAFIGPHLPLDVHFAAGNFLRDVLAGSPIVVNGDGSPLRSYLYMSDLAIWLWTILFKGHAKTAYNVGSDLAISIEDLARQTAKLISPALEVNIQSPRDLTQACRQYVPDIARARTELDLKALVPLELGLRKTLDWYRLEDAAPMPETEQTSSENYTSHPIAKTDSKPSSSLVRRPLISVVTPCYNELGNVRPLRDAIREIFAKLPQYDYEHILIDNCSNDGTPEALRALAAEDPRVKVVFNTRNFGHIRSPVHGLCQAYGDAAILMASDFQDPPEMIFEMLKRWEEGHRIVMAVKTSSNESPVLYFLRSMYYRILDMLSDVKLVNNATGFGLFDRKVMDIVRSIDDPYPYFRGMVADIGWNLATVPFNQPRRKRGLTKNNFYTLYDMAMLGLTNHSKVPLRLATMGGFVFAILSILAACLYFALKLIFWYNFAAGMAPLVIGLFLFFSVQLFFTGLIGEYILAILTQVQKRPLVVEQERINFDRKPE